MQCALEDDGLSNNLLEPTKIMSSVSPTAGAAAGYDMSSCKSAAANVQVPRTMSQWQRLQDHRRCRPLGRHLRASSDGRPRELAVGRSGGGTKWSPSAGVGMHTRTASTGTRGRQKRSPDSTQRRGVMMVGPVPGIGHLREAPLPRPRDGSHLVSALVEKPPAVELSRNGEKLVISESVPTEMLQDERQFSDSERVPTDSKDGAPLTTRADAPPQAEEPAIVNHAALKSQVLDQWAGTGLLGEAIATHVAAGENFPCVSEGCNATLAYSIPNKFTKLVSQEVSFLSRVSRDVIVFAIKRKQLELCVNSVFVERVTVLRVHPPTAQFFDQDGWAVAVPRHQFDSVLTKLAVLAARAGVPVLTVVRAVSGGGVFQHDAVSRGLTSATLDLRPHDGTLHVTWSRPSGELQEVLAAWAVSRTVPEGPRVVACAVSAAKSFSAVPSLRAVGAWVAARACQVYMVVRVDVVEGQLLVDEVWPELPPSRRAAICLFRAQPVLESLSAYGGARAMYSSALVLHRLTLGASGGNAFDFPAALVDSHAWSCMSASLLPVLRDELAKFVTGQPPLCFPSSSFPGLLDMVHDVLSAYAAARPYVHALIGMGMLEADVREAVEGATHALDNASVSARGGPPVRVPLAALSILEEALRAGPATEVEPDLSSAIRRVLVPVGRAGQAVANLAVGIDCSRWVVGSMEQHSECLVLLDLTDPAADHWIRWAQEAGEEQPCIHCLALLPNATEPRAVWNVVAAPLAALADADSLELGLVLVVTLDMSPDDMVGLLHALAHTSLHEIAFQLQPSPRCGICVPALAHPDCSRNCLISMTGFQIELGDVLASYSLYPFSPNQGCDKESTTKAGLLHPSFLREGVPPSLLRAGCPVNSVGGRVGSASTWHLCMHEFAIAAIFRRAAGDFLGRVGGKFAWRGCEDGPRARLWEIAAELEGRDLDHENASQRQESEASMSGSLGGPACGVDSPPQERPLAGIHADPADRSASSGNHEPLDHTSDPPFSEGRASHESGDAAVVEQRAADESIRSGYASASDEDDQSEIGSDGQPGAANASASYDEDRFENESDNSGASA